MKKLPENILHDSRFISSYEHNFILLKCTWTYLFRTSASLRFPNAHAALIFTFILVSSNVVNIALATSATNDTSYANLDIKDINIDNSSFTYLLQNEQQQNKHFVHN